MLARVTISAIQIRTGIALLLTICVLLVVHASADPIFVSATFSEMMGQSGGPVVDGPFTFQPAQVGPVPVELGEQTPPVFMGTLFFNPPVPAALDTIYIFFFRIYFTWTISGNPSVNEPIFAPFIGATEQEWSCSTFLPSSCFVSGFDAYGRFEFGPDAFGSPFYSHTNLLAMFVAPPTTLYEPCGVPCGIAATNLGGGESEPFYASFENVVLVPEPQSWLLLLAGLLMGFRQLRKLRHRLAP
jgi:PEP-CTERM motif-containing protein